MKAQKAELSSSASSSSFSFQKKLGIFILLKDTAIFMEDPALYLPLVEPFWLSWQTDVQEN